MPYPSSSVEILTRRYVHRTIDKSHKDRKLGVSSRRLLPFYLAIVTQDKSDMNHSTKARTSTLRTLSTHDIRKT